MAEGDADRTFDTVWDGPDVRGEPPSDPGPGTAHCTSWPRELSTLTQRLRRVEGLVYRFSEILDLLIAHGHADPPDELRALRDEMWHLIRGTPRGRP